MRFKRKVNIKSIKKLKEINGRLELVKISK